VIIPRKKQRKCPEGHFLCDVSVLLEKSVLPQEIEVL